MATSVPVPEAGAPRYTDKLVHLTMYGVLALLVARASLAARPASARRLALVIAGVATFGAADELHQRFIPGRDADVHDWLADAIGGMIGASAFTILTRRRELPT